MITLVAYDTTNITHRVRKIAQREKDASNAHALETPNAEDTTPSSPTLRIVMAVTITYVF